MAKEHGKDHDGKDHGGKDHEGKDDDDVVPMSRIMARLLLEYTREHPWLTAASAASLIIIPIQDLLLPHLTGKMVNAVRGGGGGGVRGGGGRRGGGGVLMPFVAVVVAIALLQLTLVGADIIDAKTTPTIQKHFRTHMLRCELDAHETALGSDLHAGDLLAKFMKLPFTMSFWLESVKALAPYLLVYVAAAVYFAWIDPVLGAAMTVAVVLLVVTLFGSLRGCSEVSTQRDAALNGVHETIDETLRNLPSVYASMRKERQIQDMAAGENAWASLLFDTTTCALRIKMVMVPTLVTLVGVTLWRCRSLVGRGKMSTGTFVSVFLVIIYLMNSMMRVAAYGKAMVYNWGVINTSGDLLRSCEKAREEGLSSPPPRGCRQSRSAVRLRHGARLLRLRAAGRVLPRRCRGARRFGRTRGFGEDDHPPLAHAHGRAFGRVPVRRRTTVLGIDGQRGARQVRVRAAVAVALRPHRAREHPVR